MAKVELSPLIQSMSGSIAKRRRPDGTIVNYVVTKKGTMYVRSTKPRTAPLSAAQRERRRKFGVLSPACTLVRHKLALPADPATQKKIWRTLSDLYDMMIRDGMSRRPEDLANAYCMLVR